MFAPKWASAPGETIADILEERGLTPDDLATSLSFTRAQAKELLCGESSITVPVAQRLERMLGGSARFWVSRESKYREDLARVLEDSAPAEVESLWLGYLPVSDMMKLGWIQNTRDKRVQAEECLRFFGAASVSDWHHQYNEFLDEVAFRTSPSFASQRGAVATWLKRGEHETADIECQPWRPQALESKLPELRAICRSKNLSRITQSLRELLAECGVAFGLVPAPAGCRASGATVKLTENRAMLLLSLRHRWDDHFWFTLFHEIGHLILHTDTDAFLDGLDEDDESLAPEQEDEANDFAASVLIPEGRVAEMLRLPARTKDVIRFAQGIGVVPGIVVGQLQHRGVFRRNQLNGLRRRFSWDDLN